MSLRWSAFATGGLVQHGDSPQWSMMIPAVAPVVVPSPSLDHRQFCVAGLARGHPDSGEAAIMGVPLPYLVLPLSGCLSRRTPTRATRGEARGHRSVLAQNPLLMYPFIFFLWTGRRYGVSSPDGVLVTMVFALFWVHSCRVSLDGVPLCACGPPKGTRRDCVGCVCCLSIASRCGCRPASGMSTPSRCRGPGAQQALMVAQPSWAQWFCEVVRVAIAAVGPAMVTPEGRGGSGG